MTLLTREQWGAVPPQGEGNPLGKPKGVAVHWEGPKMGSFPHVECIGKVRSIQAFHMARPPFEKTGRGWSDIAYNYVVCSHGYVFEGRGARRGSAANGSNQANLDYHSICALVGEGDPITPELLEGIKEARRYCILGAGAGTAVVGHRDLTRTACPGPVLYDHVKKGTFAGTYVPPQAPPPASAIPNLPKPSAVTTKPNLAGVDRQLTERLQALLEVTADGLWGKTTDAEAVGMRNAARAHMGHPRNYPGAFKVTSVQAIVDVTQDGIWGPKTQAAMTKWVKAVQTLLRVDVDGVWGHETDAAFLKLRSNNRNKF